MALGGGRGWRRSAGPRPRPAARSARRGTSVNAHMARPSFSADARNAALLAALPAFPAPFTLPSTASDAWAVDGRWFGNRRATAGRRSDLELRLPGLWYLVRVETPGQVLAGATAARRPVSGIRPEQQDRLDLHHHGRRRPGCLSGAARGHVHIAPGTDQGSRPARRPADRPRNPSRSGNQRSSARTARPARGPGDGRRDGEFCNRAIPRATGLLALGSREVRWRKPAKRRR